MADENIGKKYGRLTIVSLVEKGRYPCVDKYFCRCSCGNTKAVLLHNMKRGTTVSCGCYRKEQLRAATLIHGCGGDWKVGKSPTPAYISWNCAKLRCFSKTHKSYPRYGGRGITMCDRWKDSFLNFLEDMGERPPGMTIDRIDVNGNYEPSNCRWADKKTQEGNKRNRKPKKSS